MSVTMMQGRKAESPAFFVWRSSQASVRNETPSFRSISEVVVAGIAWWGYAIWFETFTHIWVSVCIAPLLLLQSKKSVALSKILFEPFLKRLVVVMANYNLSHLRDAYKLTSSWIGVFLALVATAAFFYGLARLLIPDPQASGVIWRAGIIEVLSLLFGLALGAATTGPAILMLVEEEKVLVAMGGALVGAVAAFLAGAGQYAAATAVGAAPLGVYAYIPIFALAVWIRSLAIRIWATVRYCGTGFWHIPDNYVRTVFVVDILSPAELLPGYRRVPFITGDGFYQHFKSETKIWHKVLDLLVFLVTVSPTYMYRLSMKSTCWLFLPIVYISSARYAWLKPNHLLDRLQHSPWERGRRLLAFGTLAALVSVTIAHNIAKLPDALRLGAVSPLEFLFLLDLDFWRKPWQVCNLLSALITVYLAGAAAHARIDIKHALDRTEKVAIDFQIAFIKFLMRVRDVSSIILVVVLLVHVLLLFSPIVGYLPSSILRAMQWLYGEDMPQHQHGLYS